MSPNKRNVDNNLQEPEIVIDDTILQAPGIVIVTNDNLPDLILYEPEGVINDTVQLNIECTNGNDEIKITNPAMGDLASLGKAVSATVHIDASESYSVLDMGILATNVASLKTQGSNIVFVPSPGAEVENNFIQYCSQSV